MRLDKFLVGRFSDKSRAFLQKLIKEGNILVNSKAAKQGYVLKENDEISINFPQKLEMSLEADPEIKFEVLYEDDDVIVVNKPAGLSVHPSENETAGTLVNGLLFKYPEIRDVGDQSTDKQEAGLRPGIVHRLDKDTSGVMVVARNNNAFQFLKNQFKEKKAVKKYVALVAGKIYKESGTIALPIARKRKLPTKQVAVKSEKQARGKIREAITEYRVIRNIDLQGKIFTLVEAMPKTGRMHQIRVHFSAIGHPLAGDLKYGSKNQVALPGLDRHFLHAKSLEIDLPGGKRKTFEAPLPKSLEKVLG